MAERKNTKKVIHKADKNAMGDCEIHLSLSMRLFLTFIKFKTRNGYSFTLTNEEIGDVLNLSDNTVRSMISKLCIGEYIKRIKGKHGIRQLILTGKPFECIVGDLGGIDKKILMQENKELEKEVQYLRKMNAANEEKIYNLLNKVTELEIKFQEASELLKNYQKPI